MAAGDSPTALSRLRAAVESAPSGLLMIDAAGRIVLVNRQIEVLFGYPREELLGQPVEMLVPVALREDHERFRAEFFENPKVRAMGAGRNLYGKRKDGSQVPVEIGLTPVATEEGLFVLSSVVDISERRRAEARFRAAVESSPAGMIMVSEAGRMVLVNQEIERMFGWDRDELIGQRIEMLVPERFRARHPEFRHGFFSDPDARPMGAGRDLYGLRKDGTEISIEIGLNPIETEDGLFVLSSVVDISARKREEAERNELQRQLQQAQKMEAVGTLAGGIAHDFNNILGAILGFAELLRESVEGEQAHRDLEELIAFTLRGKSVVERVRSFSVGRTGERRPCSAQDQIDEFQAFLRSSLPPNIEITTQIHPDSPRLLADPSALYQVLMNLGLNAGQAMPNGGRLAVDVEPLYVTDSRARAHPNLHEGNYVALTVRDTGSGMDAETRDRMFEPFFTTRSPERGSGLGLAIVLGIIQEHEGAIEVESAPGAGTTVRLIVPAAESEEPEEGSLEPTAPRGSGERILYVDDERSLRTLGKRRLELLGYRVTVAGDGAQALERFQATPDEFDLVITDYLMPRMNGLELTSEVRRIRPEVPIILMSGFIDNLPDEDLEPVGVTDTVQKPVTSFELATTLARVLGNDPQEGHNEGPSVEGPIS